MEIILQFMGNVPELAGRKVKENQEELYIADQAMENGSSSTGNAAKQERQSSQTSKLFCYPCSVTGPVSNRHYPAHSSTGLSLSFSVVVLFPPENSLCLQVVLVLFEIDQHQPTDGARRVDIHWLANEITGVGAGHCLTVELHKRANAAAVEKMMAVQTLGDLDRVAFVRRLLEEQLQAERARSCFGVPFDGAALDEYAGAEGETIPALGGEQSNRDFIR